MQRHPRNPRFPAAGVSLPGWLLAACLLLAGCARAAEPPPASATAPAAIAPAASQTAAPPTTTPSPTFTFPATLTPYEVETRATALAGTPIHLETHTPTVEREPISVIFTDPLSESPDAEQALAAALDSARHSIDVAMYNLTSRRLADALLDAHHRGVQVRLVMESTAMDAASPQRLMEAGIPIIGDRREGLMHNKFAVIDGYEVWTGSANWSNGLHTDNNNLLRLRSTLAAQDYTSEFEEMFTYDRFGPSSGIDTPHPLFNLNQIPVEVYFSPDDQPERRISELIRQSRESVNLMVYSFTSDPIAQALIDARKNSVYVRVVLDAEMAATQASQGGEADRLASAGIAVRLDRSPGLMHHKVMIVDRNWVLTGSYNFTRAAEKTNDENVVVIRSPALASQFMREFERVYGRAVEP